MTMLTAALMLGVAASSSSNQGGKRQALNPPASAAPVQDDDEQPVIKARSNAPALEPDKHVPDDDDDDEEEEEQEGKVDPSSVVVVTARKLDAARTRIDAALGSTVYALTNETIENRPGGETGSIADILAQAPGVSLSSHGLTVRGSRANQVRINNVIVPEAISDPAEHLSARLAETTRLITGTLPAQFGFVPGGVISITTKNGLYQHGSQAELFAGSDGFVEPALEWMGSTHATSLFLSGSLERGLSTIADASGMSARDRTNEVGGLGFADHVINQNNRVSMMFGGSHERHRFGPTTIAAGTKQSDDGFVVGTFQHSSGDFTMQSSLFGGIGSDKARFSEPTRERRTTFGTQIDAGQDVDASHTLRFGLLASRSGVHERDLGGRRSSPARSSAAVYVQDEWKLAPGLTFNPGVRVEWLRELGSGTTVEPRASLVWESEGGLTAHFGYARYASAPPLGERPSETSLPDERDDYFDAGVQQREGPLTIGLDLYLRSARNFIAERETIGSAVSTAFGFKRARLRGVELSALYARQDTTAWANIALASAVGGTIIGGEGLFSSDILTAASAHLIRLQSDRPITASGGLTYRLGKLSLSGDLLVSSGTVRTKDRLEINGSRHAPFAVVGLAGVYHARIAGRSSDLRLDLTNLTNARYVIGDAKSLEGGWTRRGRGRAITIGIERSF